jgi:hypothetical protein
MIFNVYISAKVHHLLGLIPSDESTDNYRNL